MATPNDNFLNQDQFSDEPVLTSNIEEEQPIELAMSSPSKIGGKIGGKIADVLIPPSVKQNKETTPTVPLATVDTGELRVRSATAEELEKLKLFIKEADNKSKKELDVISPNLSKIESLDGDEKSLKSFIIATYDAYKDTIGIDKNKILEKGERGFEQIIKEANNIGSVDIFLQLMKRKRGDRPFNDAELLAARRTIVSLQLHAQSLLKKAEETGDLLDMAKAAQAISIQGYANIQLVKVQEDIGRIQVSNKIIAFPSRARSTGMAEMLENIDPSAVTGQSVITANNLSQFLDAYGGEEGLRTFLTMYKRLPYDATKNEFAKRSLLKKVGDSFSEIFQSALLSNPLTHTFNIVSQATFQEVLIMERMLEGNAKEAMAMLKAHFTYFPQAIRAGYYALKHEKSIADDVSKLDVNVRAISKEGLGFQPDDKGQYSASAHFADGFGVMMRLFGYRPMLAIDEFFKAWARGMQLEAISVRTKSDVYNSVMDTGVIPENYQGSATSLHDYATEQAIEAGLKAKHSQTSFDEASEFAKMVTFQDDLPGLLGRAQGIMNNNLVKIWLPFYKTPSQIIRRISERTPLGFAMPSVIRDQIINGSPETRRKALTKISLGSGFGATIMALGSGLMNENVVMTGYGPTNPKLRKTWLETHEPYSIGVRDNKNQPWEWVSYKRYDPISGIIALAMDTAETFRWSNDTELLDDAFINLTLGVARYVTTSLPMTQFVGEMLDLAGSPYEEGASKLDRARELITKQVVNAGGVVGQQIATGGLFGQGMSATVERYVDPKARSVKPDERFYYIPTVGMQPEIRGFYEGLNRLRSRIPILSEELPVLVNRWNEPVNQGQGAVWESFVPYRIVKKPQANVINSELLKIGLGFGSLPRNMGEPRLLLTGKQYKRYVELYNDPSVSPYAKKMFGGKEYMPKPILVEFEKTITGKTEDGMGGTFDAYNFTYDENEKKVPSNRKQKITILRDIDSKYKGAAKELMLMEFPELRALKAQIDDYANEYGENPPMLFNPTGAELRNANEVNRKILNELQ